MPRTNYERGVECERHAIHALEAVGYRAMRTAGSHGLYDVIAEGPTGVRLIQCKRTADGKLSSDVETAREVLTMRPRIVGISRELWVWQDYKGWIVQEVCS